MSISKKLLQSIGTGDDGAAAVCNSESIAPFGNEASYNKNEAIYEFEDNANDSSGNGHNGTGSGLTYVTGKFGKAGSFDGTNDKIDLPDNILPSNSTASSSASVWFKHAAWTGSETLTQCILDSWNYDTSKPAWSLFIEPAWSGNPDGHIYLANYYLGGSAITGSQTWDDDQWHHAVVVFDQEENKLKLYMDGYLFGTQTTSASNVWIFADKCAIGYQNAHPSHPRYYNGEIDQVRIYSKALSHEEVVHLFLNETTSTASSTEIIKGTSCVAYYSMDFDSSDKSGNFDATSTAVEFGKEGKINYAADFDGSTSYIQMTDNIFQYSALSISMWFWGPPSTSGWNTLFNNSGYISGNRFLGYILACVNDKVIAYLSNTSIGSDATYTMSASYNIGAWNFIVATMDSTNQLKMYLNGASAESFTTGGYGFNNSYPMNVTIGTRKSGQDSCTSGCEWFPDRIDEVRVFNRILSSDEATTLYELTSCTHTSTTENFDFPAANQIAHYSFDSNIEDLTLSGNDATNSGITYGTGRFGFAGVFDAADYIDTNISFGTSDPLDTWTISFWAYRTVDAYHYILGTVSSNIEYGFALGVYASSGSYVLDFITRQTGTVGRFKGGAFTLNKWHHFTIVNESNSFTFYQNGLKLVATEGANPEAGGSYTNTGDLKIGRAGDWTSEAFAGKIDQCRIWYQALTLENVFQLYENEKQAYITPSGSDPFGGSSEVAFFKFDNNLTDSTGSYAASASSISYTTTDPAFGTHSLSFNDTNNYIDFGTSGKIPVVSVSYWVKMNSAGYNTRDTLIYSEETSSTYFGCIRWGSNDGATSWYAGGSAWTYYGTDWQLEGKWHHVYQDEDLNVYLNGVQINSGSAGGTSQNIRYIGQYPSGNADYYMNGYMDHLRVFNTKLTGEQIWQLYDERNGLTSTNAVADSVDSDDYFNTVLYAGSSSTPTVITGVGFKPDLVWLKARNNSWPHGLYSSLMPIYHTTGGHKFLYSNTTGEATAAWGSLQFDSNGWSGLGGSYNGTFAHDFGMTGYNYLSWNWKAGADIYAASFDGSSSKIEVSDPVVPNGATSISFWYNPEGSTGTEYILGSGIATASKGVTVYWHAQSFGALVTKGTSDLAGSATGSTTYSTTSWHHVVFTWDGSSSSNAFKVYVNGALLVQGTSDTSSSSIGTYTTFAIGGLSANQSGSYTWASGLVDQVRIYNAELSSTQVTSLYNETADDNSTLNFPTGAGCISAYTLNQTANDVNTSDGHNGTATNVGYIKSGYSGRNNDGSVESQVSANQDAGFSIVTFTNAASGTSTVGHGLGKPPEMIIMKQTNSSSTNWVVYNVHGGAGRVLVFNGNNAYSSVSESSQWGAVPDSSVFTVTNNSSLTNASSPHIAYCWTSIPNHSKIGAYTGNGSTFGPIITTGFEPAWLMVKKTSSTGAWNITDNKRNTSNPRNTIIEADASNTEYTNAAYNINFNSDGFQIANTHTDWNTDGGNYIFMCFGS